MVDAPFYIFSSLLLLSGACVIFARNTVHAVLFLILAFFNGAGLFILLGAEFLAMMLVIVYVGAVAVLFLFVVMMLAIKPQSQNLWFSRQSWRDFNTNFGNVGLLLSSPIAFYYIQEFIVTLLGLHITGDAKIAYSQGYLPVIFVASTADFVVTPAMRLISGIFIVNSFAATMFWSRRYKISLGRTCLQLYQALPLPILVGFVLLLEMIMMMWLWQNSVSNTSCNF